MNNSTELVTRQERGWAGHFIGSTECLFRRNTLLTLKDTRIVVSTIGLMKHPIDHDKFTHIGWERYYETMAFHSDDDDHRYHDADVTREVIFDSPWSIDIIDADDKANDMHEAVCDEITDMLTSNQITYQERE